MKFKYLLLLAASALLMDIAPVLSVPAQVAIQLRRNSPITASDLYAQVNPAVVTVYAGREIGSGSIVTSDGLVITNHHVVRLAGNGAVSVRTAGGQQYSGRVIGIDRRNDLALIQLNTSDLLPTIRISNAGRTEVGEQVYAIGSPFGRPGVMTSGTLRAIRSNGDLQSRVTLNPGNSGGPLLNAQGEMIGINKSILESQSGENTGISFATSSQVARALIARYRPNAASGPIAASPVSPLAQNQPPYVVRTAPGSGVPYAAGLPPTRTTRPAQSGMRLGVILDTQNMVVQQVQLGSPAAIAGLQPGDRLLAINGNRLRRFNDLQAFLNRQPEIATFTISRNARAASVQVRF